MTVPSLSRFKRCFKCKCWKPATLDFFGTRGQTDLQSYCRICASLNSSEYYAQNKERIQKRSKETYVPSTRKKLTDDELEAVRRESKRRWAKNNKEKIKARRQKNKGKAKEYFAKWRKENREKWNSYSRNVQAQRQQAPGSHTQKEILDMYEHQQGLCAYCEVPLFGTYHVEHMTPLSRGGRNDWTNLAISCPPCNTSKRTLTAEEFMNQNELNVL